MKRWAICLCIMLTFSFPEEGETIGRLTDYIYRMISELNVQSISAMEALELVKEQYAANFERVFCDDTEEEYYYKLPNADYYLVYEGMGETHKEYLFHLYEFVLDEPDTGTGHTVTYGWYTVNKETGTITDWTLY